VTVSTVVCVSTPHASQYIQRLCKHWTHKFQVECTEWQGRIFLPAGACATLVAEAETLHVGLETSDIEVLERMQDVIEIHLVRLAFKEKLDVFVWHILDEASFSPEFINRSFRSEE
jgi:uncharacterized protein